MKSTHVLQYILVKNIGFVPRWVLNTPGLLTGIALSITTDLTMSAGNVVGFHIGISSEYHVDLVIHLAGH